MRQRLILFTEILTGLLFLCLSVLVWIYGSEITFFVNLFVDTEGFGMWPPIFMLSALFGLTGILILYRKLNVIRGKQ